MKARQIKLKMMTYFLTPLILLILFPSLFPSICFFSFRDNLIPIWQLVLMYQLFIAHITRVAEYTPFSPRKLLTYLDKFRILNWKIDTFIRFSRVNFSYFLPQLVHQHICLKSKRLNHRMVILQTLYGIFHCTFSPSKITASVMVLRNCNGNKSFQVRFSFTRRIL